MRYFIILITACCLLTGCRVNPRAEREIALLRAEILDLEDQYYALKDRCGSSGVSTSDEVIYDAAMIDDCESCEPGMIVYDNPADVYYDDSAPEAYTPSGDYIESSEPTLRATPQVPATDDDANLEIIPQMEDRLPEKVSYPRSSKNSQDILTAITINREASRGEDIDGIAGHEGLSLLLQPLDDNGNVHKIAGKLIVRVSESPSLNVEREVGLWQFSPRETESFFVKDGLPEQGILLHLPWDGQVPTENYLDVKVSYITRDNRRLNARLRIHIQPPGAGYQPEDPLIAGWIEKDDRWIDVDFQSTGQSEIAVEEVVNPGSTPSFRVKAPKTERRISAPGWRPVR